MTSDNPYILKIIPATQQYDWGKRGREAKVAQFAEASKLPGFTLEEEKPYAELWMGTHPSGPSRVKDTGESLSNYLQRNPHFMGDSILSKFEDAKKGNLPFLFKILSISKALSIQSHPDKETAKRLHAKSPDIYKDPNHKPEMVLALTPFQALRSNALKDLFSTIMTLEEAKVRDTIDEIITRYTTEEAAQTDAQGRPNLPDLIERLQTQFPYDIGILCAYLLNYVHLSPGESIFLGAGEPHAYISGEAIECMANSDNVIRAGLTPKLRDVPNLVDGLTYESGKGDSAKVNPEEFGSGASRLYDPPIEEFSVVKVSLEKGAKEMQRAIDGPSIFIVTDGSGRVEWAEKGQSRVLELSEGDVAFAAAANACMALYRAFVEA
ncbi:mannose-6-phosphate isomerase [Coprinopsis sp. MPI-PUGE-AT-0042]|nr:mannose-6-phosphate isomerase [Coprinopsis sp. MPI-PUGE-AT-0042]